MKKTPVAVIGFVRSNVLAKTLNNLSLADGIDERDVYVYLSAPRNAAEKIKTEAVRDMVLKFQGGVLPNMQIVQRTKNNGAGKNIRFAITETLKHDGTAIVIEEDVLVSRTFLRYMDDALAIYRDDKRVWCINGYKNPYLRIPRNYKKDVYLNPRNMAWGWGIWRDRWETVDFDLHDWNQFKSSSECMAKLRAAGIDIPAMVQAQADGRIDTWDVQSSFHMVKNGLYAVEPRYSLTKNIGFASDGSVHCKNAEPMLEKQKYYNFMPHCEAGVLPNEKLLQRFTYSIQDPRRLMRYLRRYMRLLSHFTSSHDQPINL